MLHAGYFLLGLIATTVSAASNVADLVGTWSTKSRSVITGPGFYDPINDQLLEPNLTGISYSFTSTGHYEEAYYRALSNPTNPECPRGIMQWQHGTYTVDQDGTLLLRPIEVDGRQLLSDPCSYDKGVYTRYNQTEKFNSFTVSVDPYHNVRRLDLQRFDDSIMHPMYLVYQPPEMLPTDALNLASHRDSKKKRHVARGETLRWFRQEDLLNPNRWLWLGLFMTAVGGFTFIYS
ncbi:protein rot1 [Aspergillus ambiguus]|uniref:protein rot1 n=1 Tax=Aspergillus ambiguus TaxID=176160 RepID=UPI003CCCC58E